MFFYIPQTLESTLFNDLVVIKFFTKFEERNHPSVKFRESVLNFISMHFLVLFGTDKSWFYDENGLIESFDSSKKLNYLDEKTVCFLSFINFDWIQYKKEY